MTNYLATIRHHSIASARSIEINGTVTEAKRAATREFGGEFLDYVIVIHEVLPNGMIDRDDIIAAKRVGAKRWH